MGRWVAKVMGRGLGGWLRSWGGRGLGGWGLEGCALPVGLLFEFFLVNVGRFIVVSLLLFYDW